MKIRDKYLDDMESGKHRFIGWVVLPLCAWGLVYLVVRLIMLAMAE